MYSTVDDVKTLLSQLNFDGDPEIEDYITAADNEIDSVVGYRYVTPVSVDVDGPFRATHLILKKLSSWLAAGTALTSVTAATEVQDMNDYGRELLRQARLVLEEIQAGTLILVGATEPDGDAVVQRGPATAGSGDSSQVDSFYTAFGNPASIVASGFSTTTLPARSWCPW